MFQKSSITSCFNFFFCGLTEIHGNPACLIVENLDAKRRQRDKGGQTGQISQKGKADIPKRKGTQGRHPKKEANPRQTSQKGKEPKADIPKRKETQGRHPKKERNPRQTS